MPVGAAPPNGMMPGPPMAPPSLPQMPALDALCSHAVREILQAARFQAKQHVYVGFHAACAKMCELMGGVANLGQLGVHDPAAQVPLLGRIQRIEQMVTAFVGSYMSQRSVVTLTDMEKELVVFLRSYNLQPKTTRHVEGGFRYAVPDPATNSEEISLDDDDDEVREVRLEFLDMGVGWFTAFPAIIATFGKIENVDEESWACPNVSDALAEFLDLPANAGRSDDGLGADFEKFLIESLRKEDQKKLSGSDKKLPVRKLPGFWIRHDSMPHERQCTRHVQNAKRAELARLRDEAFGAEAEAARAAAAAKRATRDPAPPRLKDPTNPHAASFIDGLREELDTRWHPSRSKVDSAVRKAMKENPESLFGAAVEYGMLHLGGGKHRVKVFKSPCPDDGLGDSGAESDGLGSSSSDEEEEETEPLAKRTKVEVKPEWEGRMGVEFRDARATGHHAPVPDTPSTSTQLPQLPPLNAITTVTPGELAACLPWWSEMDGSCNHAVGRWGEQLVYQYLLQRHSDWTIEWVNEHTESKAFYDVKMTNPADGSVVFVEVKTTRSGDKNAFEVSPWEWDFACRPGVEYHVYRVYSAGERGRTRVTIVRNPAKLVREHAISMALAI